MFRPDYSLISALEEALSRVQTRALTKHAFHTITLDTDVDVRSSASLLDISFNYMRVWSWECYSGKYQVGTETRYIEADSIPMTVRLNSPSATPIQIRKNLVLKAPFTKLYFEYKQSSNPTGVTPQYMRVNLFLGMNVSMEDDSILQQLLKTMQQMSQNQNVQNEEGDTPLNVIVTGVTPILVHNASESRKNLIIKNSVSGYPVDIIPCKNGTSNAGAAVLHSNNHFMRLEAGESIQLSSFTGMVYALVVNPSDTTTLHSITLK